MSKLLQEIRQQPEHIRHIMMWLCVVITFSLVGFVWFKSTQAKFVAMLHSEEVRQEIDPTRFADRDVKKLTELAVKNAKEPESPFASIGNAFSLLKASIIDLMGSSKTEFDLEKKRDSAKGIFNQSNNKGLPLSEFK